MPSETQPADPGLDRTFYDEIRADLGEDPMRFLYSPDGTEKGALILARIRGIDKIALARAWRAVERREYGRKKVLGALEARIEELQEIGERPDRLVFVERDDQDDDQGDVEDEPDPVYIHVDCGAEVDLVSKMAADCPECEQRVSIHRVEQREPGDVE